MYKQYDGYPNGWGEALKEFIDNGIFVNGINDSKQGKKKFMFNGIGCFALQLVTTFKEGVGDLYATSEKDAQEYNYEIEYISPYEKTVKEKVVDRLTNEHEQKAKLKLTCDKDSKFNKEWIFKVI